MSDNISGAIEAIGSAKFESWVRTIKSKK